MPLDRRRFLAILAAAGTVAQTRPGMAATALQKLLVAKDPSCGCCTGWVDHMRAAGFPVEVIDTPNIDQVKARLNVPADLSSCHTAEIGGYVVEGHVPADAVGRLLAERPNARGLSVPGMPVGSPGMEVDGAPSDTYEVVMFGPAGRTVFASYKGSRRL